MAPGGFSRWPGGGPGMKIFENFSKIFWCPKCVQNEYLGGKKWFGGIVGAFWAKTGVAQRAPVLRPGGP